MKDVPAAIGLYRVHRERRKMQHLSIRAEPGALLAIGDRDDAALKPPEGMGGSAGINLVSTLTGIVDGDDEVVGNRFDHPRLLAVAFEVRHHLGPLTARGFDEVLEVERAMVVDEQDAGVRDGAEPHGPD